MDCLVCVLDLSSALKTSGPWVQRSVGDRQKGSPAWGLSDMEGRRWKMNRSALAWGSWAGGKSWPELFTWLCFSVCMLWGSKDGRGWSLLQKNSMSPSSQNNPHKAGFLWGLRENVLWWEPIMLFLPHSARTIPANTDCSMCLGFYIVKTRVFSDLAISSVSITQIKHKGLDFNLDTMRSLLTLTPHVSSQAEVRGSGFHLSHAHWIFSKSRTSEWEGIISCAFPPSQQPRKEHSIHFTDNTTKAMETV